MRLLRRIYRMLAGQCVLCGTRLTALEETFGGRHCFICDANMDSDE